MTVGETKKLITEKGLELISNSNLESGFVKLLEKFTRATSKVKYPVHLKTNMLLEMILEFYKVKANDKLQPKKIGSECED